MAKYNGHNFKCYHWQLIKYVEYLNPIYSIYDRFELVRKSKRNRAHNWNGAQVWTRWKYRHLEIDNKYSHTSNAHNHALRYTQIAFMSSYTSADFATISSFLLKTNMAACRCVAVLFCLIWFLYIQNNFQNIKKNFQKNTASFRKKATT